MSNPTNKLEALLRDTCRRALVPGMIFDNQIRLYRAVIALAREVRLRFGTAMPETASDTLAASLEAVCDRACELGLDPDLSLFEALQVQRLVVQLSRATRLASGTEPANRRFFAQEAQHREKPPEKSVVSQNAPRREEPAQPEPEPAVESADPTFSEQHAMQRETEASNGRLTAWRDDRQTEPGPRAHQRLRTAIDERVGAKIEPIDQRDRAPREAA
jgi:hypothetical protein